MSEPQNENRSTFDDIDMERVVIDPDYRRIVIRRLRRNRVPERMQGRTSTDPAAFAASDED
jgi:hypothetical protein